MTGRPRTFDYDEAKRLRAQGLTYMQIGARLGVSHTAAAVACDSGLLKRQRASAKKANERAKHPCFGGCGRLVWGHVADRSGYCMQCAAERRRTVKHGTEKEYSQGCRCEPCRLAASAAKRQRRINSRVPCSHGCGTLVDSINRRQPDKPPECAPCSRQRILAERRQEIAA